MTTRMRRRITTAKREEIEAEQKILDSTIVRPFTTLEDLPVSYNEPPNGHYEDILKSPLTIKDSAVLYNSLIRSRSTYIYHAPMFKLHWVKQTAYAKKLAEMDKEKQKEILSDRENKRRFAKATTNSLEARTRTPVLSPEVNARDVMSKLCESSISLGPHTMEIRIFIAKDSRSEKSRAISEISKIGGPSSASHTHESNDLQATTSKTLLNGVPENVKESCREPLSPDKVPPQGSPDVPLQGRLLPPSGALADEQVAIAELRSQNSDGTHEPCAEEGSTTSGSNANVNITDDKSNHPNVRLVDQEVGKQVTCDRDDTNLNQQNHQPLSLGSIENPLTDSDPKSNIHLATPKNRIKSIASPPPSVDPSGGTHALPTCAGSNSIGSKKSLHSSNALSSAHMAPTISGSPPAARPTPTNLQSIDNTIMISNLNAIAKIDLSLNDLMKEVALGKASEAQISRFKRYIERAKQMGPQPHHAELYFNRGLSLPPDFPRPFQTRPVAEKKALPKPKVFNSMKLTAFQEKYLHNATLVFEFLENPNVRYIIPQDSICEILKPELPVPQDAETGMEYNDVLISHLWIHNIDEMEKYENACAHYKTEVETQKKEDEVKANDTVNDVNTKAEAETNENISSKAEQRGLRTKRKLPPQKKKKALVQPEPPHIKYTTFSFTIHNIPSRYVPIFTNSMRPIEDVQRHMENILKTGTRITSFYLWYQVDARLDESFAENLRTKAVGEEKKMSGFVPPVEPKKRKPRDYKASKVKKMKPLAASEDNTRMIPEPPSQSIVEGSGLAGDAIVQGELKTSKEDSLLPQNVHTNSATS